MEWADRFSTDFHMALFISILDMSYLPAIVRIVSLSEVSWSPVPLSPHGSSFFPLPGTLCKVLNCPVSPMPPISARKLPPCWINGWKKTPPPCWRAGLWSSGSVPREPQKRFPPRNPAATDRILCPIIFLRIEAHHGPQLAVRSDVLSSFWSLDAAFPLSMLPTPSFDSLPEGVLLEARAKAHLKRARLSRASSSHPCAAPPLPFSISPSSLANTSPDLRLGSVI